ncbi:endonuclease/exonuclease/phosphatase family protein [Micromonospora sp. CPCC 206061]|uniref:endonuclease/exonuclease/phosphatase family protein n=1 Tax=Micromonospora sp. CPCC 206061 TaxID=3122410 RepID=UPI002FEF2B3B
MAGFLTMVVAATLLAAAVATDPAVGSPPLSPPAANAAIPELERNTVLGKGWRGSTDRAWAVTGDADGLHVLVADAAHGYAWRTVATLSEPGVETDRWVGNACVTGSGSRIVVVYAPRTFTNRPTLSDRGAFTAVVDAGGGRVRKLAARTSLAYFNPSCGAGETAVLTQAGDVDLGRTRLLRLDTASGQILARIEVPGQLTSAVPAIGGIVAADAGAVVRVAADGTRQLLARASGVPFRLAADADGGVVYVERTGAGRTAVRRVGVAGGRNAAPATLAEGGLTGLDVTSGRGGQVYVTGAGRAATPVPSVSLLDAPAGSQVSMDAGLAVTSVLPSSGPADPRIPVGDGASPRPVTISGTVLATGRPVTFGGVPTGAAAGSGRALSPALTRAGGAGPSVAGEPDDPADFAERYCSVPRNDPANQAMQPKPRQVEWAVDQAVRHVLNVQRPANWKNLSMPAYTPQGLFPPRGLLGGGHVPAQVMLGIAAQESNLWQAARFAVPGVTANPLIGNYYGLDIYNGTETDDWAIRWEHADCGYGVTQVTDGMRRAGREKPGETALPYDQQRAIALDFAANIAEGLRILESKWNQTRAEGLVVNNGDPSKIENWFYAVWAYNSGFYPPSEAPANGGAWGVGWANNPANPRYPANRGAFLEKDDMTDDYADAAHPQDWPYPEKVMGWAGHPVEVLEAPDVLVAGYRAAWWNGGVAEGPLNRHTVSPPHDQFCNVSNNCEWSAKHLPDAPEVIGEPAGPCAHRNTAGRYDLKCWYHEPATWKPDCDYSCGNELLRFDPGYPYQEDGTAYPPRCDLSGLPAGARIVDNLPDGTPSIRPGCGRQWTNAGTFTLSYRPDAGQYPGKIDTHQLGMGFGGHFWMSNARAATAEGGRLDVTGRWRFSQSYTGLAKVMVHLPPLINGATQARYVIKTAYGDRVRIVPQQGDGNRWVPLGVFRFNGPPEVTLTTLTPDGDGTQRVAFDAVAYVPVTGVRTVKILHWNIAGAAMNEGDYYVIDRLMDEVRLRSPDVLTLNEICKNQYNHLRSRLADAGYQMEGHFRYTDAGNPTCFNAGDISLEVGNALFVKAPVVSRQSYAFWLDNELVEDDSAPGRTIACITARFSGTAEDAKVCATHLETGYPDKPDAGKQARELARVFGPEARQKPFILVGDTNISTPPHDPALSTLYGAPIGSGDFGEIEQERACLTSTPCGLAQGGAATFHDRKLDYIFADHWHFHIPVGRAVVNQGIGTCGDDGEPCSDHYLLYGEVLLATS